MEDFSPLRFKMYPAQPPMFDRMVRARALVEATTRELGLGFNLGPAAEEIADKITAQLGPNKRTACETFLQKLEAVAKVDLGEAVKTALIKSGIKLSKLYAVLADAMSTTQRAARSDDSYSLCHALHTMLPVGQA